MRQCLFINAPVGFREENEHDPIRGALLFEKVAAGADGDPAGILDGVSVYATADGGKCDGAHSVIQGQLQAAAVAGRQQPGAWSIAW